MVKRVLVAGATGGVGQLTVAKLIENGYTVRVLIRNAQKARQLFDDRVEIAIGDIRDPATLPEAVQTVDAIICTTGTTALPSTKWDFAIEPPTNPWQQAWAWSQVYFNADYRQANARNSPEQVDAEGVRNLVVAAPKDLQRFIFVSSCGIERKNSPPYNLLNAFGVLDAKQQGEQAIVRSGLPYTIVRPGRLIDGPFTASDLNTLLQAKTNGKLGVVIGTGDTLTGQTSRIDVAAACVAALSDANTENQIFELINQGARPVPIDWAALFAQLPAPKQAS